MDTLHTNQYPAKAEKKQIVIFFLWLILVIFLFLRHENWRDEAQAWLLARDLDFLELIDQMKYEGHPCLWQLVLMPFAKFGFPYETINVISITITAISVGMLLWKAPFPFYFRVLCLCGVAFLHSLPVISRSYCLIPVFLFMNANSYHSRKSYPLRYGLTIALLVQTHIYMLGMAGVMGVVWMIESFCDYRKEHSIGKLMKQAAGLLIPLLSFLFLLLQLSSADQSSAFDLEAFSIRKIFYSFMMNFQIHGDFVNSLGIGGILRKILPVAFCIAIAAIIMCHLINKKTEGIKILLIFGAGVAARVMITAFLYSGNSVQKMTVFFLMVIWLLWVIWPYVNFRKERILALIVLWTVCIVNTLNVSEMVCDISDLYSDAKNCARYIESNIPDDAIIFQDWDPGAAAILPYLDQKEFCSLTTGEYTSYVTWKDMDPVITDYDSIHAFVESVDGLNKEIYLLVAPNASKDASEKRFPEYVQKKYLVYETKTNCLIEDEYYRIYKLPRW